MTSTPSTVSRSFLVATSHDVVVVLVDFMLVVDLVIELIVTPPCVITITFSLRLDFGTTPLVLALGEDLGRLPCTLQLGLNTALAELVRGRLVNRLVLGRTGGRLLF